ncbi:hypothetical protein LY76DRAFT_28997 [Colletotrichum caudatum]|nr:hypothetical protein LY76DRAFT_28997 [Colletotrichum caudatum]
MTFFETGGMYGRLEKANQTHPAADDDAFSLLALWKRRCYLVYNRTSDLSRWDGPEILRLQGRASVLLGNRVIIQATCLTRHPKLAKNCFSTTAVHSLQLALCRISPQVWPITKETTYSPHELSVRSRRGRQNCCVSHLRTTTENVYQVVVVLQFDSRGFPWQSSLASSCCKATFRDSRLPCHVLQSA